ncbi:MAG: septum formation protein Maf [Bacteroidetes bacterium GWE2_29_8]|nr:MAG: septum formation protein Maf [Bacteroidetes bacterium GWE2_29_8]OFY22204.1 MAG: septum formation protein Maf [Bacteroidetes bacterium GWF2_29_10]
MNNKNPLPEYNYILGSASPRRKQLLEGLNLEFKIIAPDIDETYPDDININDIPVFLSNKKAEYFNNLKENDLLICADTIVIINNIVLNKPTNNDDAKRMLSLLSNNIHEVVTGVTFKSINKLLSFSVKSVVHFKKLTIEEIDFYIKEFKPYDKAGSYGVQEWIGYIGIEKIEGSYYNVMGLPIKEVYENLLVFK